CRAEAAAHNVVAAQLGQHLANVIGLEQLNRVEPEPFLQRIVGLQVCELCGTGRGKKITLGTISRRMSKRLFEGGVEGNRVERHLDVDRCGELGAHSTHALAGGTLALRALTLEHQNVFASGSSEMIRNARSHNSAADNHYLCC